MLALLGLQSHLTMVVQTSSTSTLNYAVVSKFEKVLIWKINALIWFRHKEEELNGR